MPASVHVLPDEQSIGSALASEILGGLACAAAEGRHYLLGCPGGRSLRPTYRELAAQAGTREADLRPLVVVMMDEYVLVDDDGYRNAEPEAHYSCLGFAQHEILAPLVAAVPPDHEPETQAVWVPSAADPAAYDEAIDAAGGIDLFLLASGSSDGHVAFNPPGAPRNARTGIVELARSTREDNLRTFPDFAALDEVPRWGVSVGPDTIARHSRSAALVCSGSEKRTAAAHLRAATTYDPGWPASIVHDCANGRIYLDHAAAEPDANTHAGADTDAVASDPDLPDRPSNEEERQ